MNASALSLSARERQALGRQVKQLRREGLIPAIVYGYQQKNTALAVSQQEFELLYHQAGSSTLVELKIDDHPAHKVLIQDVQYHPLKRQVLHVDFYRVNMKEKLQTEVPLEFIGESSAIEIEGGSLLTVKTEVEIECLPDDLISQITVDISFLKTFDDMLRVKDLVIPAGITILADEDEPIASVTPPRSEEEMEALETPAAEEMIPEEETPAEGEGEEGAEAETEGAEKGEAPTPRENE